MSAEDITRWLHKELFNQVPFNIAIIDRDHNIIEANKNFEEYFGPWQGKKCYEAYKGRFTPCENCMSEKTFADGMVRVTDEVGIDRYGRTAHYVGHIAPVKDSEGNIPYIIEMTTDVTETKRWQREYSILFERAPCYIVVVDENFDIIRANERFRETFGDTKDKRCYEVYKRRKTKCANCPAVKTLKDGKIHSATMKGLTKEGKVAHYVVTTAPLSRGEEKIAHVIEMAADVTEIKKLEDKLAESIAMRKALIHNSPFGIIATDPQGEVTIVNPEIREILKHPSARKLKKSELESILPAEFFKLEGRKPSCILPDTVIHDTEGEEIPVSLTGLYLKQGRRNIGAAAFIRDLRLIKQLEKDKLEAERLAAVGQTVAGLAHSVKNILMGLEGGMYMVRSGLKKNDQERISEGWEILERNFQKTTSLVKDFLSFSKGRLPEVKMVHPNDLVEAIVGLYRETAQRLGIELTSDCGKRVKPAPLDPDGIHTCLTNLVSNAIDACEMSEKKNSRVVIRTRERNNSLIFEVTDNGSGMDYNIKQKVFTSFFTTKGGGGTGLGLLTTRKIVQELGGKISLNTVKGKGSTFRMEFPRDRLPELSEAED